MAAGLAPSRESGPRAALSASVLLLMLLSLPVTAGVRGPVDPASSARIGLSPHFALPVEIARRLCAGIRYEMPDSAPVCVPVSAGPKPDAATDVRGVRMMRPSLLDLPPPAATV